MENAMKAAPKILKKRKFFILKGAFL